MIPISIRFHDMNGERTETFNVTCVPRRGDNLFWDGQRFEVAQVQHLLGSRAGGGMSAVLVIATVIR